jgi:hydroxymethylpyrimidine pyrophosphatase-like HAD family hydrolase
MFEIIEKTGIGSLLDAIVCEERDIYIKKESDWVQLGNHKQQLALELSCMPNAETVYVKLLEAAALRGWNMKRSNADIEAKRGYMEVQFSMPEESEECRQIAHNYIKENGFFLSAMRNVRHIALRHPYSKKGFTLRALAEFLGLHPNQVTAVGDSLNDMSMLDGTFGFVGAAVSNSDEAILKAVRKDGLILPKARSSGVACLLELLLESREII